MWTGANCSHSLLRFKFVVVASCGTLAPLAVAVIAGAAGGMAGNLLNTAFAGGNAGDFLRSGFNGAIGGAISGLVGGAVGKWAVKGLQNWGINGLNSPVLKGAIVGAGSSSLSGGAGAFTSNLILTGDLESSIDAGFDGF
ncbi:hypothetical protein INQ51_10095 [Maribellus sp. CM-23]|uniref:hypothetical protein n=1 Tax=Maribellus sp. CM-23 TaxID=2781026 RepID=UPI001F3AF8A8|nr:hypothetical protein [Maribellus sp. CM-23]MCE4564660.1 hypothetical protein [Maribellus sp. CM-23]